MLWLDAVEQGSPALWLLLTTSVPVWDGEQWMRSIEAVTKAVRRRWPAFEYACLIEFTTGYGPRSGGHRRPHANVFVRGVPVEDAEVLWLVVAGVWCPRMAAREEQQRVTRVDEDRGGMRGLTRYVGMHFLKESQAPPVGWRGQRFRATRGYFTTTRGELRQRARESLRDGRRRRRLQMSILELVDPGDGRAIPDDVVDELFRDREDVGVLERMREQDESAVWSLVRVDPSSEKVLGAIPPGSGGRRRRPARGATAPTGAPPAAGRLRLPDLVEIAAASPGWGTGGEPAPIRAPGRARAAPSRRSRPPQQSGGG